MKRGIAARLWNRAWDLPFRAPVPDRFWLRGHLGKVACLVYHRVGPAGEYEFLDRAGVPAIPDEELADEIRFFKKLGARFLTFSDLRDGVFPAQDELGVILAFDDGFADSYRRGLSVLESEGVTGMVFQSTAMLGAGELLWEHAVHWYGRDRESAARFSAIASRIGGSGLILANGETIIDAIVRSKLPVKVLRAIIDAAREEIRANAELDSLAAELYPHPEEISAAIARGHEIGSHGHEHLPRSALTAGEFVADLETSLDRLSAITGARPAAYAYPFGQNLAGDENICRGRVSQAATVGWRPIDHNSDPLALPRIVWPGPFRRSVSRRRWRLTGRV